MSKSDAEVRIPIRIEAADGGTEVFLVDSGLNRIDQGVGALEAAVAPGVYKARFRAGSTMVDQLFEVPSELPPATSEIVVTGEPVQFESSAPLPGTATDQKYQTNAWRRAARAKKRRVGSGGGLLVLARDPEKHPGVRSSHRPWHGLSLRDADGIEFVDFEAAPDRDDDLGYTLASLEVDPGPYFLRVSSRVDGVLEMPVWVARDWQTQVFLSSRSDSRRQLASTPDTGEPTTRVRSARRADLADASVFLVRSSGQVDPQSPSWRLTELARIGLAQGRSAVRQEDLQSLVIDAMSDPMLGIIGANVLLAEDEPDMEFVCSLVGALTSMAPDHPDVAALRLAVDDSPIETDFPVPPMLLASWTRVVRASTTQPSIVPIDSLSAKIAGSVCRDGVWLVWRRTRALAGALRATPSADPVEATSPPAPPPILEAPMIAFAGNISPDFAVGAGPPIETETAEDEMAAPPDLTEPDLGALAQQYDLGSGDLVEPEADLTPTEFALLSEVDSALRRSQSPTADDLVDTLEVPRATVAGVVDKLRLRKRS